jgi:AhpD family alkylhydroperoxidase
MNIDQFQSYRQKMNDIILETGSLEIKRFFQLDSAAYRAGALPAQTKELLGLVASMVLRCNDCILYHLIQCHRLQVTDQAMWEAWNVALVVGGSIVIPHLRFAVEQWQGLQAEVTAEPG